MYKARARYSLSYTVLAWGIIVWIPVLVLWWRHIIEHRIEIPQVNSTVIVNLCVLVYCLLQTKITQYPGYRKLLVELPLFVLITFTVAVILLVFRIPYSVYQLTFSFFLVFIYFIFKSILIKKNHFDRIDFIPFGRGQKFYALQKQYTNLHPINEPSSLIDSHLIVADLSSFALDERWQRFLARQAINGVFVYNYLQVYESLTGRSPIYYLYENDLGALQPSPIYLFVKRMMDIALVLLSLPITLPIMLCTWLAIRLDSTGKAIFSQTRIGQGGKPFVMYKFRSMYAHAPAQNQQMTQANDARITRVGRVIRKLRIDELPQFYNVLKGDMSLIGPRPELPNMVTKLEQEIPFYIYRQIVKPGISGWAQVMQGDGHVEDIQTKLEYDFYYIKNFSFTLDFLIVVKTVQTMLTGFGAR